MHETRTSKSSPRAILSLLISLFTLHTQSLSLTSPTNLTDVWSYRHCVSDPSWNPQGLYIASSCENALVALSDDSLTWGLHPGTFVYKSDGRSTAFFPGAPSLLTLPKRYVNGDCVVAIVMMKMFERSSVGQFPGLPDSLIGKWRTRDTIFWKDLVRTSPTRYFFVQAEREHRDIVSVLLCPPRKDKTDQVNYKGSTGGLCEGDLWKWMRLCRFGERIWDWRCHLGI